MRLAWVALMLASACSLQRMEDQPRCGADGTLDGKPCDLQAPAGAVAWNDVDAPPPPLTRALVERGRARYDQFCSECHGEDGDAQTEVNRAMKGRVPSLLAPAMTALPDDRVLSAIAEGYKDMPRQPLSQHDRWAVLHYVRVLQSRDVPYDEVRGVAPW